MGNRLFSPDEPDEVRSLFGERVPTLRRRKKVVRARPKHPEQIHLEMRERAKQDLPKQGWHWPFGWFLLVWNEDWTKQRRRISSHIGYEGAKAEMRTELERPNVIGAMLIRRTYEPKPPKKTP